jgi:carbon storage regulator CsrA
MLVLSRKLNQKIKIDGEIEIVVVRIDRHQVRLAIRAPDHIRILRDELNGDIDLPVPNLDGPAVGPGLPELGGEALLH